MTQEATAVEAFRERYRADPEIVTVAPGRVNLIGEHTDYNEGFVFPAAIDRQVVIAARRSQRRGSAINSLERKGCGQFDAATAAPGQALDRRWWDYVAGMAWALRDETNKEMPDVEAIIHSTVPIGSGVSSSAALEMACAVMWNELAGLALEPRTLAKLGQRCENRFIGVNSGIMDQMASAMGRAGHALFIDTRSLEVEYAPVPDDLAVVLCDTKKPRALSSSAYNERRKQCEAGARALGVTSLREATLASVKAASLDPITFRRCRHVVTENQRCIEFKAALNRGDRAEVGRLMRASHESLRDDYEVSCAELDAMAEAAWSAPGCVGARMTGAGFGGACVALVAKNALGEFTSELLSAYDRETNLGGEALTCDVANGAHRAC
ncbi:MAG TPA: galactokinase [Fimbriimonadaceae bacterium]|nr:galactokinase [Fimbriimonadaceae bacterium]